MQEKELQELIAKYLASKATAEQKQQLDSWYAQQIDQQNLQSWPTQESEQQIKQRMQAAIYRGSIQREKSKKRQSLIRYTSAIAASIILALGIYFSYTLYQKQKQIKNTISSPLTQIENRHIILQDSSIVILRPGGRIILAEDFGEQTRSLELIGEAYFDIKPNKDKPFIIRAGDYTTRVLGTAFSIKSPENSQQFSLVVDHGKVQIEKQNKVIGVLKKQDKYASGSPQDQAVPIKLQELKYNQELSWKDKDMVFQAIEFQQLAQKLERRYDVKINFASPELKHCRMTGVFSGTDNLEEVLSNLCLTSSTQYSKINDKEFLIDGEKCFN